MYSCPMLFFRRAALPLVCLALATGQQRSSAQSAASAPETQSGSHFPTNEDLRRVKALSSPQLSPDGKQIMFAITQATAEGAGTHLWLAPVPGSGTEKARQLTFSPPSDKRGEHNAQWSPDSSAIYFLAKRADHTQLFRLDLRGGDASPYDLKIMPAVDVSKDKDAIHPPPPPVTSDKKDDKKPNEDKVEPLPIDVAAFAISNDGK